MGLTKLNVSSDLFCDTEQNCLLCTSDRYVLVLSNTYFYVGKDSNITKTTCKYFLSIGFQSSSYNLHFPKVVNIFLYCLPFCISCILCFSKTSSASFINVFTKLSTTILSPLFKNCLFAVLCLICKKSKFFFPLFLIF